MPNIDPEQEASRHVRRRLFGDMPNWSHLDDYHRADREDAPKAKATSGLTATWLSGDTLHGNLLRNRFTPLEWTLMALWPRHDRQANAHAWRIVRARLDGLMVLLQHQGIAGPGDPAALHDDLVTLYGTALKQQIACESHHADQWLEKAA